MFSRHLLCRHNRRPRSPYLTLRQLSRRPRLHSHPKAACSADMLVLILRQGRTMAAPLSQLAAIDPDESTAEAIDDWHYWVDQGFLL
jgi:hypothetical protein